MRDTSTRQIDELNIALRGTDLHFVIEAKDANTAYDVLIEKYKGIFDTCFPFKNVKGKEFAKMAKPWISRGLLKSVNKKNKLYQQYLHSRTSNNLKIYKTYRNKLTRLLRLAIKQ